MCRHPQAQALVPSRNGTYVCYTAFEHIKANSFEEKFGFPQVLGVVDGTHM